ncbi:MULTISPECIES: hypothetical protein [unclassified Niallia]|uniref:hypothetical protein n=1 Tax=unclassified Niallia TaxID=2837522 RepID=UPI00203D7708|nr:hypothetical protein [Niallia sp. MER 6]MCM3030393.1 hypothetical protein [Niallia sp. MER 6]
MAELYDFYSGVDEIHLFRRANTPEDPFIPITQELTVKYNKVKLLEIPDYGTKVSIESKDGQVLKEVDITDLTKLAENEYRVNYSTGDIALFSPFLGLFFITFKEVNPFVYRDKRGMGKCQHRR